ncbi:YitT family protein [Lewinella sp. JB7]|uniref:YitT family protein n=1 Tax=Lewinella sp. JB7 TaxID=2962887 RepID=UPI0020C946AF|nr:YitT family protein [Lewinella sp. JB7]MCP9236645.1 YitT family protein [Lewinella sp. JB7]
MNRHTTDQLTDGLFICLGVLSAAFGLKGLLLPSQFIDGGVTGVCLLLANSLGWSLPVLLVVINVPFLMLARVVIGRTFAIKTAIAIGLLAIAVGAINFPFLTEDRLLVAIFGGFFIGTGIGLSMRGGGVLDGTEVLAIFLSRKVGAKVSDWVILINVVIFLAAAAILSVEQALYSLLTYIVASKALDFIIDGVEEYTGVTIISKQNIAIRTALIEQIGCGVTIYRGQGGFGYTGRKDEDHDILYVVITRLEIRKLTLLVQDIDARAFITMSSISDVHGGMIKRRPLVDD